MADETNPETTETAGTATETAGTATEAAPKPAKLNQTVELVDIGPCKKHIKVSVDRADIDTRFNAKYSELVVDANVAGFRPGKAPRRVIEKRFQKDVGDQVKAEIMLQSLEQLAEDYDVAPLSPPDLDPRKIEIPRTGPLVYEFDVEVRPQFDLPDYKGLKLRRPVRNITDADVDDEQRRLLSRYGQVVPKEAGNAQIGDVVIGDLSVEFGGKKLGEMKECQLRVERQVAFKDGVAHRFAEQMKNANPGEKRSFDITLTPNVADPALSGKTIQAVVDVKDVKTIRPPELTHELLHEFGVHTPEALRERILVVLSRRLEYVQRQSARQQVLQHIAVSANWELPNDLLVRQARSALGRRVMEMRASGMSDEEINGRMRLLQQDILNSTAIALKEHFVLQKIAEVEKIEVKDDDVNDEIDRIAVEADESPRRVRARLEKDDLLESLAIELIERKVLDIILANAEYEDVQLDQAVDAGAATVEQQAIAGEMKDPMAEAAPAAAPPSES